jgi:hypothetical protein
MLQIFAIILLGALAMRTSWVINQKSEIFAEVQQSKAVQWLVWLFPLPFVLPFLDRFFWHSFFPLPLAALFFVPGIVMARNAHSGFDRSGNLKRKEAASTMGHVVTFGILGVMGVCIFTIYWWLRRG